MICTLQESFSCDVNPDALVHGLQYPESREPSSGQHRSIDLCSHTIDTPKFRSSPDHVQEIVKM